MNWKDDFRTDLSKPFTKKTAGHINGNGLAYIIYAAIGMEVNPCCSSESECGFVPTAEDRKNAVDRLREVLNFKKQITLDELRRIAEEEPGNPVAKNLFGEHEFLPITEFEIEQGIQDLEHSSLCGPYKQRLEPYKALKKIYDEQKSQIEPIQYFPVDYTPAPTPRHNIAIPDYVKDWPEEKQKWLEDQLEILKDDILSHYKDEHPYMHESIPRAIYSDQENIVCNSMSSCGHIFSGPKKETHFGFVVDHNTLSIMRHNNGLLQIGSLWEAMGQEKPTDLAENSFEISQRVHFHYYDKHPDLTNEILWVKNQNPLLCDMCGEEPVITEEHRDFTLDLTEEEKLQIERDRIAQEEAEREALENPKISYFEMRMMALELFALKAVEWYENKVTVTKKMVESVMAEIEYDSI